MHHDLRPVCGKNLVDAFLIAHVAKGGEAVELWEALRHLHIDFIEIALGRVEQDQLRRFGCGDLTT